MSPKKKRPAAMARGEAGVDDLSKINLHNHTSPLPGKLLDSNGRIWPERVLTNWSPAALGIRRVEAGQP
jgi:hypothetical protein